jgi:hypothetical protein
MISEEENFVFSVVIQRPSTTQLGTISFSFGSGIALEGATATAILYHRSRCSG